MIDFPAGLSYYYRGAHEGRHNKEIKFNQTITKTIRSCARHGLRAWNNEEDLISISDDVLDLCNGTGRDRQNRWQHHRMPGTAPYDNRSCVQEVE